MKTDLNILFYLKEFKDSLPKILLAFSIVICSTNVIGQNVEIKDIIQENQRIKINYILTGNSTYEVELYYCRTNSIIPGTDLKDWWRATHISGDCGENQRGSTSETKIIIWDVLERYDELAGQFDFKIVATDKKGESAAEIKRRKKAKKQSFKFVYTSLNYSCNPSRAPFGASILIPKWRSRLGIYIDLKTDFRLYAPGEWALRERSFIESLSGSYNTGAIEVSNGGTDISSALSLQVIGNSQNRVALLFGGTLSNTPVFEIYNSYSELFYTKGSSINHLYLIYGVTVQHPSGWSYGFTARLTENIGLDLNNSHREYIESGLTIFLGGTF